MANFDTQLQRMKSLMTYGAVKENKKQTCGAMEYHALGADGKAYGIIRENQKFYIKTTDKNSEMIAESYEYIGGFNNKKQYEYSGLAEAKKNFDMKLLSLKEAYAPKTSSDINKFTVVAEEMSVCGKNMMNEIARQRQIMANASAIMKESATIGMSNTGNPEAPKTSSFEPKAAPFTETATAELDKDMKATASNPEKQGEPFGDTSKAEEPKDAEYVPQGSVANQKPKGGKVVKVDESTKRVWEMMAKLDKTFTLNESCDEWGSCGLPSSEGVGSPEGHLMEDEEIAGLADETVIDDSAMESSEEEMPEVEGEESFDDEDDFDFEMFDDEEVESDDESEDEFDEEDFEEDYLEDEETTDSEEEGEEEAEKDMEGGDDIESLMAEIETLKARIAELEGEKTEEVDVEDEMPMDDELDGEEEEMSIEDELPAEDDIEEEFDPEVDANYDDEFEDEEDFDDTFGLDEDRRLSLEPIIESVVRKYLKEDKLNDFGKHPGYRKKPMTLPATGSDEGDWNDESVYSEAPFGEEIGDGAPYTNVVDKIVDCVMEDVKKKI